MTYPQQPILSKPDPGSTFIHSNSTITASGSTVVVGVGSKELTLVVNITASPTGGSPTLIYTLQEVDPGDQTATFGSSVSTVSINAIGVYTVSLGSTLGGTVKVSWVVGGSTPSFTGVYATASTKIGNATNSAGTVVVTDSSIGSVNTTAPTSAAQVGGSDGTNLQAVRVFDADTGGGTQYLLGVSLRKSASGGSVEAGTSSDPVRTDPTGTTTQPVSGTVTANIGTSGSLALDATLTGGTARTKITDGTSNAAVKAASTSAVATDPALVVVVSPNNSVAITAASLPLPTGAATESTLSTRLADSTFTGRINTLGQKTSANSTPVVIASDQSAITVSGTVTATNPSVSTTGTAVPSSATMVGGSDGTNLRAIKVSATGVISVDGSAVTQPISAASLPLPTGAATSAKQPALGTAGTASTDVITIQGIASMTAIKVDGSAVTQPVSGTITANIGTSGSLALDATLTGGTAKAIIRGGAKGSTTAADVTSTATGANHQALDVAIVDASGAQITSFGGGTQFADGAARGSATGTLIMVDDGTNIQSASGDSTGKLNVNSIQSTAAALSGAWPVKVTDGTNSMPTGDAVGRAIFQKVTDGTNTAAVKAASTAAVATDPSLVVALSPNFGITGNFPVTLADPGTADSFGHLITASRIAHVMIPFFSNTPANLVTVTTTGTGTSSQGTGTGIFSTGASAGGQSKGVSFNTVAYAAHYEIYAAMTAAFTTGVASTTQRLGIYNTTDGFSFGYNGATFGLWTRFNTTDTFVSKASWNVDTLSGSAGSKFTLSGSPVALDPTKINLYRIRYGWLGIANAIFEVLAPDGNFVIVHVTKFTNASTSVSLSNPNLPLTLDVNNLAVATNLTVTCGCWVAGSTGPGSASVLNGNGTIAANGASVVFQVVDQGSLAFSVSGTWSGTLGFQYSLDGVTWTNDVVLDNTTGGFVNSTTTNQAFETDVSAYKLYRITATAWSSGTATVTYNGGTSSGTVTTITRLTDASNNGPAAVKPASTAAVATDPALVVAISPNNPISVSGTADATATGALGALNAAVQVTTAGLRSVGFQLAAGTLVGTIIPEVSFDGGTTWVSTYLSDPTTSIKASSVVFGVANTATAKEIVGVGGSGLTRIRVSSYTSGTANITLRASLIQGSTLERTASSGTTYTTLTSPTALAAGLFSQVTSYGTLKVTTEGSELFVEPFDGGTIDVTDRWTATAVGGGSASQANGTLTITTGTTASNAYSLVSKNTFRPIGLGFQIYGVSLQLEAAARTNNHRFWGLGTQPVSWAATTPIQDGVGFEQDTTGALNAVTYSSGTRSIAAVLTRPSDGAMHRYAMYIRADLVFWYVDTLEYPVASASWPSLGAQTLPIRSHSINHTSGPSSGPTFNIVGIGVTETSHSGVQISDGTFAWRKATVKPASTAAVATDSALVVALSPNNSVTTIPSASGTATLSNVSGSASSVQLLASNSSRKGVTIYNDSAAALYVKLGTTASTTSFTVRLLANGYYELPFSYTGRIDGIWASATGSARLTELT